MRSKNLSFAALSGLFVALIGLIVLAGCGGGSSTSTTPPTSTGTPAATLSASSLTFTSAVGSTSAVQVVTVTDSGSASLTFSGFVPTAGFVQTNTCGTGVAAGGTCTINVTFTPTTTTTVSGTLTITDNAGTQTVTLSGSGTSAAVSTSSLTFQDVTVGTTSAPQPITLTNEGTTALTITSVVASSSFADTNNCPASLAGGANCTINVTYSSTAAGSFNGTITITDSAGTQTVNLTGSNTFANTVPVTVGFGINGNTGNSETNYYNGIFTTVTVCQPATTNCVQVPNVLVDTGSVGLRVLSSAIGGVTLNPIHDSATGYPLYECVQYGDLSYTWGPMEMATVQVGGETASQVPTASGGTPNTGIPIQVIAAGQTPPASVGLVGSGNTYYNACLYYPDSTVATGGANDDTTTALGANGILGVGNFPQDCGSACTTTPLNGEYLVCTAIGSSSCGYQSASLLGQAWNPAAAFPVDNNGVSITLPTTLPAAGQASATGSLTFGIGTGTNNGIPGTAAVYELDVDGNFASASFNGVSPITSSNSGGTFIDSGSNSLFVSDANTLGTIDCIVSTIDIGYYCPSSTMSLPLGLSGSNGTSTSVTLSIANAQSLFANSSYAAFNDLGGPSCEPVTSEGITCNLSDDYFDLGLPFFFQRGTVFVGIAGATTGTPNQPNGYWAF